MNKFKYSFNVFNIAVQISLLVFLFQESQASRNEFKEDTSNNALSRTSSVPGLTTIPPELISYISHYLGGRDFLSFTSVSTHIRKCLQKDKSLFVNADSDEDLIKVIEGFNIRDIEKFFFSFSRNLTTKKVSHLKNLVNNFSDHLIHPNLTEVEAQLRTENLKMSIKIHRLLVLANSKESNKALINIKENKLRDLKTIHQYNNRVEIMHIAKQAFLVFPKVETFFLRPALKQMLNRIGISIAFDIVEKKEGEKGEESLNSWIPQISTMDDQF